MVEFDWSPGDYNKAHGYKPEELLVGVLHNCGPQKYFVYDSENRVWLVVSAYQHEMAELDRVVVMDMVRVRYG